MEIKICKINSDYENIAKKHFSKYVDDPHFNSLKNKKRICEFWNTISILEDLLQTEHFLLKHHENGAPYLENSSKHISISHSKNYIAVAIHQTAIGIDLECEKERTLRLSKFFLNEEELRWIKNDDKRCTMMWCAKEAIYKIHQEQESCFNFQTTMAIFETETNHFVGKVKEKDFYNLTFKNTDDYIFCIATKKQS